MDHQKEQEDLCAIRSMNKKSAGDTGSSMEPGDFGKLNPAIAASRSSPRSVSIAQYLHIPRLIVLVLRIVS